MGISVAMVALGNGGRLSMDKIRTDLEQTWPDLPPVTDFDEKDEVVTFAIDEALVALAVMPAPIPWEDLEGPCETSWIWEEAADVLKKHTRHVIVSVAGELTPIERATLLTQVTAAVVETTPNALGVYWGDATLVIPPDFFRDQAVNALHDGPPAAIWVDVRVGPNDDGTSSGFTTGLAAFDLMEFETEDSPDEPADLLDRLLSMAEYILTNGLVIKDGNTVGGDADEKIRVAWTDSAFGNEGQVIRLNFGEPKKVKKRRRP